MPVRLTGQTDQSFLRKDSNRISFHKSSQGTVLPDSLVILPWKRPQCKYYSNLPRWVLLTVAANYSTSLLS